MIDFAKNGFAESLERDYEVPRSFAERAVEMIDDLQQSYYASRVDRYLPANQGMAAGSNADYHYQAESDFLRMMERGRQADRDNMVFGQGVTRAVANIFQTGITCRPDSGDDEVNEFLGKAWLEWSTTPEACDIEGERTFNDISFDSYRDSIPSGDSVVVPLESGELQCFEPHRLRNPYGTPAGRLSNGNQLVHGVELSGARRREAFWLTYDDVSPNQTLLRSNRSERYPARDEETGERIVFQIYSPKRVSQTRGITALAPIVLPLTYHDDLQFATAVKAKVATLYAIIREQDISSQSPTSSSNRGNRTTTTREDGSIQVNVSGGPGQEYKGLPGETVKGFAPNIPAPAFFQHSHMLLTFVSITLDLPLIVFLLDATQSNFSAWRGALQQARLSMKLKQQRQIKQLHNPTYRWRVYQEMRTSQFLRAKFRAIGNSIFRCKWIPQRWEYIEPAKDAAANDLRMSSNQASLGDIAEEIGAGRDEHIARLTGDRAALIRSAIEEAEKISQDTGAEVDWREIAYGHKSEVDLTKAVVGSAVNEDSNLSQQESGDESE